MISRDDFSNRIFFAKLIAIADGKFDKVNQDLDTYNFSEDLKLEGLPEELRSELVNQLTAFAAGLADGKGIIFAAQLDDPNGDWGRTRIQNIEEGEWKKISSVLPKHQMITTKSRTDQLAFLGELEGSLLGLKVVTSERGGGARSIAEIDASRNPSIQGTLNRSGDILGVWGTDHDLRTVLDGSLTDPHDILSAGTYLVTPHGNDTFENLITQVKAKKIYGTLRLVVPVCRGRVHWTLNTVVLLNGNESRRSIYDPTPTGVQSNDWSCMDHTIQQALRVMGKKIQINQADVLPMSGSEQELRAAIGRVIQARQQTPNPVRIVNSARQATVLTKFLPQAQIKPAAKKTTSQSISGSHRDISRRTPAPIQPGSKATTQNKPRKVDSDEFAKAFSDLSPEFKEYRDEILSYFLSHYPADHHQSLIKKWFGDEICASMMRDFRFTSINTTTTAREALQKDIKRQEQLTVLIGFLHQLTVSDHKILKHTLFDGKSINYFTSFIRAIPSYYKDKQRLANRFANDKRQELLALAKIARVEIRETQPKLGKQMVPPVAPARASPVIPKIPSVQLSQDASGPYSDRTPRAAPPQPLRIIHHYDTAELYKTSLAKAYKDLEKASKKIAMLEREEKAAHRLRDKVSDLLIRLRDTRLNALDALDALAAATTALAEQTALAAARATELEDVRRAGEAALAAAREELRGVERARDGLVREINDLREELRGVQGEAAAGDAAAQNREAELKAALEGAEAASKALEAERDTLRGRTGELEGQVENLTTRAIAAESRAGDLETELSKLYTDYEAALRRVRSAEERANSIEDQLAQQIIGRDLERSRYKRNQRSDMINSETDLRDQLASARESELNILKTWLEESLPPIRITQDASINTEDHSLQPNGASASRASHTLHDGAQVPVLTQAPTHAPTPRPSQNPYSLGVDATQDSATSEDPQPRPSTSTPVMFSRPSSASPGLERLPQQRPAVDAISETTQQGSTATSTTPPDSTRSVSSRGAIGESSPGPATPQIPALDLTPIQPAAPDLLTPQTDVRIPQAAAQQLGVLRTSDYAHHAQEYRVAQDHQSITATVEDFSDTSSEVSTALEVLLTNYIGALQRGHTPEVSAHGDETLATIYYLLAECLEHAGMPITLNGSILERVDTTNELAKIKAFFGLPPTSTPPDVGELIINYYLLGGKNVDNQGFLNLCRSLAYTDGDAKLLQYILKTDKQGLFAAMHDPDIEDVADSPLNKGCGTQLGENFKEKMQQFKDIVRDSNESKDEFITKINELVNSTPTPPGRLAP